MSDTTEPTAPAVQPFPWQLLSNERLALMADLQRIDQEIAHLHHRADFELKPIRDVLTVRLADVTKAVEQYEAWQRERGQ